MVNCGLALGRLGRRQDGLAVCDRLTGLFGQSSDPELRARVAWAMVNKGCFLQELGRDREAVAVYEEVHRRFAGSTEATAAYLAGRRNMRIALSRLGRTSEAAAIGRQLARLADNSAGRQSDSQGVRIVPMAAAAVTAWLVDSWITIVVHGAIPQRHPSWLAFPLLYVDHQEHSGVMLGVPSSRFLLVPLVGLLGVIAVRYAVSLPLWARIAFGTALGGAVANAVDYSVTGSVTDFLGIGTLGIWSTGDISIFLGLLAIVVGGMARPEALARGLRRGQLLLFVLSFGIVATVISGSVVWMEWAGLFCAAGLLGAFVPFGLSMARRRVPGCLPAR